MGEIAPTSLLLRASEGIWRALKTASAVVSEAGAMGSVLWLARLRIRVNASETRW